MDEWIELEEAAHRSGLHPNTLRRLLRRGVVYGYKSISGGRLRWLVSPRSLKGYADPVAGVLLDKPGPKIYLAKAAVPAAPGR